MKYYNNKINFLIRKIKCNLYHYDEPVKYNNINNLLKKSLIYKSDVFDYEKYKINKINRVLLYNDNKDLFKLFLILWPTQSYIPQHNHDNMNCFMKILDGELEQVILNNRFIIDRTLKKDDISFLNDNIGSHSISNLTKDYSYSLNLYYK